MLALALASSACSGGPESDGDGKVAAPERGAAYAVGYRSETFADPSRTIATTTYYPAASGPVSESSAALEGAAPALDRGPFPLVLFSHGGGTTGTSYSNLLTRIAAAGYVVVAPNYTGPAREPERRPADARFVITSLLAVERPHPLAGLADPSRVGAMGHSMGGGVTLGFVFNSCCHDDRVRAAVLLASTRPTYPGEAFPAPGVPVLVVHGDADSRAPYAQGRQLYADLRPPKHLLTIHGGEHTPPFSGEMQRPEARLVVESIVAFLDEYMKDQAGRVDGISRNVADESLLASFERA